MLKALFVTGILLGIAAVFAAAGFYPWIDHPRLVSRTQVLPNGGRREDFFIRLPVDQIASVGTENLGLAVESFPGELELPAGLAGTPLQVDHFKVRDAGENVVGIAARHMLAVDGAAAVAWCVTLPSRGAVWLAGSPASDRLAGAFRTIGYQPGEPWNGDLEVVLSGGPEASSGNIHGGSDEFEGLSGSYVERWHLTGVGDAGELRGTIELNTTSYLVR